MEDEKMLGFRWNVVCGNENDNKLDEVLIRLEDGNFGVNDKIGFNMECVFIE